MWPGFKSHRRRHLWVEFVVCSLLWSERLFSGYSGFPFSPKTNIFKFQFHQESGRRRTTLWMCYLQIIIYFPLFIYLLFISLYLLMWWTPYVTQTMSLGYLCRNISYWVLLWKREFLSFVVLFRIQRAKIFQNKSLHQLTWQLSRSPFQKLKCTEEPFQTESL